MNIEKVFLYILQAISGLLGSLIAHITLKYLNNKALGMQTIFDQMVKYFIYNCICNYACNIATNIIVEFLAPINCNIAIAVVLFRHTFLLVGLCQICNIMLIRYLSVFHANLLNNEIRVMLITRLFVLCTAPTLALIGGYENTDIYVPITKVVCSIHLCWSLGTG